MERFGEAGGHVVLVCEGCGERLVLGGPEEVWLSTRTVFECECGKGVSLASRVEEGDHAEGPGTKPAPRRVWLLEGGTG